MSRSTVTRALCAAVFALVFGIVASAVQAAPLYLIREAAPGTGLNDVLLKFDGGVLSEIGPTGFGDVRGLAWDHTTNTLFGLSRASSFNVNDSVNRLFTIDLATGTGTAVGPFLPKAGSQQPNTAEMAVDAGGTLYALGHAADQTTVDTLFTVDKASGAGTAVGSFDNMLSGLAINHSSGQALGATPGGVLYEISLIDGGILERGYSGATRIAFDQGVGTLWGIDGNNMLGTIDLLTLEMTPVLHLGNIANGQVYAMDFVSAVPVPGALPLLASALALGATGLRRRAAQ